MWAWMRLPSKHDHHGNMLWEDDFCCCRSCGQAWDLTEQGWKPRLGQDKEGVRPRPNRPMRPVAKKKGLNRGRRP